MERAARREELPPATDLAPPGWGQRAREMLIGRDIARLALSSPSLATRRPVAEGRAVLLVPGFGAGDASLTPLRLFLRRAGHNAQPIRLGRITDDVEELYQRVTERAAALASRAGKPVALIGWSIGGVLSREAARDRPGIIDRVITFGTPVEGGPSYTALASRYRPEFLAEIRAEINRRNDIPITVPITAIWSRNDGVVLPAACIDRRSPDVEHIRVSSTHLGLGLDPTVWRIVADRLGR